MVGRAGGSEEGVLAKNELPSLVSCTTVNDSREVLDIRAALDAAGNVVAGGRERVASVGHVSRRLALGNEM
jgi:hypothetical protein